MKKFLNNFRLSELKNTFTSGNFKKKINYVKGSIISIIIGLVISSFLLCYENVNPFEYFTEVVNEAFDDIQFGTTMQWFALYVVVGLSIAFSFKCGLFNIGSAGQMIAGSGTVILIFGKYYDVNNISIQGIIGIFFICTIMGTVLGSLAGFLKAKFKIHEVVSTIMLNWIVWYIVTYFIYKDNSLWGTQSTISIQTNLLSIGDNIWLIPVIIAMVCVVAVWFTFKFTTFGLKLKSVGLSPEASKNAGININRKIIQALAISGLLSGIGSFLDILTLHNSVPYTSVTLPTLGFDSISIALVAFNNPIGMVFVSFLWAIIQGSGGDVANLCQMSVYISNVIFGIIIYTAAISEIFVRMNGIAKIKYWIFLMKSKIVKSKIREAKEEHIKRKKVDYEIINNKIDEVSKQIIDCADNSNKLSSLKKELKILKLDKLDIIRHEWKKYKNNISQIRQDEYKKYLSIGKYKIINVHNHKIDDIRHAANRKINITKINFKNNLDEYMNNINEQKSVKYAILKMKKLFNVKKQELLVNKDISLSDITYKYVIINRKIELNDIKDKKYLEEKTRFEEEYNEILVDYEISKAEKNKSSIESYKELLNKSKQKHKENIKIIKHDHLVNMDEIIFLKKQARQNIIDGKEQIKKIKDDFKLNLLYEKQLFQEDKKILEEEFAKSNSVNSSSFNEEYNKFINFRNLIKSKLSTINNEEGFDGVQNELNSILKNDYKLNYNEIIKIVKIYESISKLIINSKSSFINNKMYLEFKEQKNILKVNIANYKDEVKNNIALIDVDKSDDKYYFEIQNIQENVSNKIVGGMA